MKLQELQLTRHILLGMLLGIFLLASLWGYVQEAIYWFDWHNLGWVFDFPLILQWLLISVAMTMMLLVIAPKPLTGLAALRVTVLVGFFIILVNYVINFALDSSFGRWGFFGRFGCIIDYGWLGSLIGAEIQYPDLARIITYVSLGYVVARNRGIKVAILTSIAIALVDSILGWLAIELAQTLRSGSFSPLDIPQVLALNIQLCLLTLLGLVGALLALVRKPSAPLTKKQRRFRPACTITPRSNLGY